MKSSLIATVLMGLVLFGAGCVGDALKTASTTTRLDLSGQKLDRLPASVFLNIDLKELNVSNNRLGGALPSEINKLTALESLNASNNLMTGVPAEIGQLENLKSLDLSNNSLTGLPNELGNLKNLEVLNLKGNSYSQRDLDEIRQKLPATTIILVDPK